MTPTHELKSLSDDELLRHLSVLLSQSRRVESDLIAHIGEVDKRRLYAREASSSMFAYCMDGLHLSEHEAYLRIAVARASRKYPELLVMLGDGRLHLSAIARLAPHLTETNRDAVLARAVHKSKTEIEELIAELAPRPDVSGHTHGGQVRIEILEKEISPSQFISPYVHGLYEQGRSRLYVSQGIGTSALPIRLGAPPEITLITLTRA